MVQSLRRSQSFRILFNSPELVEEQRSGFHHFLKHGIAEELSKISFIEVKKQNVDIEVFLEASTFQLIAPDDNSRNCIIKMKTYACKLYVQIRIVWRKKSGDILMQTDPEWVLLAHLPMMTKRGHFVINGSPRVIVHQVVRAPGVYFQKFRKVKKDDRNKARFYGDIIPRKGVWVRLQISKTGQVEIKLKKSTKVQAEMVERCLAVIEKQELATERTFQTESLIGLGPKGAKVVLANRAYAQPTAAQGRQRKKGNKNSVPRSQSMAITGIFKSLVNQPTIATSYSSQPSTPRARDLASKQTRTFVVRSHPLNVEKVAFENLWPIQSGASPERRAPWSFSRGPRGSGGWAEQEVDHTRPADAAPAARYAVQYQAKQNMPNKVGKYLSKKLTKSVLKGDDRAFTNVYDNLYRVPEMKELEDKMSPKGGSIPIDTEFKRDFSYKHIFATFKAPWRYSLGRVGRHKLNKKFGLDITANQLTSLDIQAARNWLYRLRDGKEIVDDIDHSQNRRVRQSGELIQNQFENGVTRLRKLIRRKLKTPTFESLPFRKPHGGARAQPRAVQAPLPRWAGAGTVDVSRQTKLGLVKQTAPAAGLESEQATRNLPPALLAEHRPIRTELLLCDNSALALANLRVASAPHNWGERVLGRPPARFPEQQNEVTLGYRSSARLSSDMPAVALTSTKALVRPRRRTVRTLQEQGLDTAGFVKLTRSVGLKVGPGQLTADAMGRPLHSPPRRYRAATAYSGSGEAAPLAQRTAPMRLHSVQRRPPAVQAPAGGRRLRKAGSAYKTVGFVRAVQGSHLPQTTTAADYVTGLPSTPIHGAIRSPQFNKDVPVLAKLADPSVLTPRKRSAFANRRLESTVLQVLATAPRSSAVESTDNPPRRLHTRPPGGVVSELLKKSTLFSRINLWKIRENLCFYTLDNPQQIPQWQVRVNYKQTPFHSFIPRLRLTDSRGLLGKTGPQNKTAIQSNRTEPTYAEQADVASYSPLIRKTEQNGDLPANLRVASQPRRRPAVPGRKGAVLPTKEQFLPGPSAGALPAQRTAPADGSAQGFRPLRGKPLERTEYPAIQTDAEHAGDLTTAPAVGGTRSFRPQKFSILCAVERNFNKTAPLVALVCGASCTASLTNPRVAAAPCLQIFELQARRNPAPEGRGARDPMHSPRGSGIAVQAPAQLTAVQCRGGQSMAGKNKSKHRPADAAPAARSIVHTNLSPTSVLTGRRSSSGRPILPLVSRTDRRAHERVSAGLAHPTAPSGAGAHRRGRSRQHGPSLPQVLRGRVIKTPSVGLSKRQGVSLVQHQGEPTQLTKSISLNRTFKQASELFSTKPINGALREFFGSNPLSQYMDQTNPLAEVTHKRRISSLGIGGVSRESAGMAIRGIHPTHYGRICPIETPEGKNAGLVNSLALYAKINKHGFIETPYYKVIKGQVQQELGFSFYSALKETVQRLHLAPSDLQQSQANMLGVLDSAVTNSTTLLPGPAAGAAAQATAGAASFGPDGTLATAPMRTRPGRGRRVRKAGGAEELPLATSKVYAHPPLAHRAGRRPTAVHERRGTAPAAGSEQEPSFLRLQYGNSAVGLATPFIRGDSGCLVPVRVADSLLDVFKKVSPYEVDCMGISPVQILSVATSLIPFLEHNDANRALMGSNMQRQAVPLMISERPIVGTGLEALIAAESGQLIQSSTSGLVSHVSANKIIIERLFNTQKADPCLQFTASAQRHGAARAQRTAGLALPTAGGRLEGSHLQAKRRRVGLEPKNLRSLVQRKTASKIQAKPDVALQHGVHVQTSQGYSLGHNSNIWLREPRRRPAENEAAMALAILKKGRMSQTRRLRRASVDGAGSRIAIALSKQRVLVSQNLSLSQLGGTGGFVKTKLSFAETKQRKLKYLTTLSRTESLLSLAAQQTRARTTPQICSFSINQAKPLTKPTVLYAQQTAPPSGGDRAGGRLCSRFYAGGFGQHQFSETFQHRAYAHPTARAQLRCAAGAGAQGRLTLLPFVHSLRSFSRSNQETCLTQKPVVHEGEWVQKGEILTDCSASEKGELAVGKNVLIAYLPWEGYNFEDAIVVSDRLTKEQIYASLHIERYVCEAQDIKEKITNSNEWFTRNLPGVPPKLVSHLDTFGFPKIGTILKEGDILVGKMRYFRNKPTTPYEKLLSDILGDGHFSVSLTSLRVPKGVHEARVISHRVVKTFRSSLETTFTGVSRPAGTPKMVHIFLGEKRSIQIGDKMSGRHGNKGIISTILPKQDMPYLPDGSPIDILLNPLGVPSRMNVGQIFESLLGLASTYLNQNFKITAFDELYGVEASQSLVYLKLYQARLQSGQNWLFQINFPGKTRLIDGRSGECFDQWVTVGRAYMLKLIHMVNEKIHARNTGPYALITQQPLRGRSQKGGQRLGEMEVWALEGYGAAYILQELLTKKSDDFAGRQEIINSLVVRSDKFSSIDNPYRDYSNPDDPYQRFSDPDNPYQVIQETRLVLGHPEIFKTLICELQALCLDVGVYALKKESFQREYLGIVN